MAVALSEDAGGASQNYLQVLGPGQLGGPKEEEVQGERLPGGSAEDSEEEV
ncbi:hypothetical protein DSO57_1027689 [Entomophthora muscae]|uniref:Uncharacterized protein n=1 Tax=Entomophthora muscae TaxID=34485 RepID=A0ACC2RSQ4_9FUNG|nr:hypothetical protein DSO57_1027689 [Entomophthora muscae]